MKGVEELLKSVITLDDGLKIISNLENKLQKLAIGRNKEASDETSSMLEEFKEGFYKSQVVVLTLAINPDLNFLSSLQEWFSNNLEQKVVFDLKVDPQIIGGAKIICREHYRDFSLWAMIEEFSKDDEILSQEKDLGMPPALI